MATISTDKGSDIPPMPPTVDLPRKCDGKKELLGWGFLVSRISMYRYSQVSLIVLVGLAKLATLFAQETYIQRPGISPNTGLKFNTTIAQRHG